MRQNISIKRLANNLPTDASNANIPFHVFANQKLPQFRYASAQELPPLLHVAIQSQQTRTYGSARVMLRPRHYVQHAAISSQTPYPLDELLLLQRLFTS